MKKIVAVLLLLTVVISACACSQGKTPETSTTPAASTTVPADDGEMTKDKMFALVKQIYEGAKDNCQRAKTYLSEYENEGEFPFYECEVKSGEEALFGKPVEFEIAVSSQSNMEPDPFYLCLIKAGKGADTAKIMTTIKDNAKLDWQVCVIAEGIIVEENNGYILMVMGTDEETSALGTSFKALKLS